MSIKIKFYNMLYLPTLFDIVLSTILKLNTKFDLFEI